MFFRITKWDLYYLTEETIKRGWQKEHGMTRCHLNQLQSSRSRARFYVKGTSATNCYLWPLQHLHTQQLSCSLASTDEPGTSVSFWNAHHSSTLMQNLSPQPSLLSPNHPGKALLSCMCDKGCKLLNRAKHSMAQARPLSGLLFFHSKDKELGLVIAYLPFNSHRQDGSLPSQW